MSSADTSTDTIETDEDGQLFSAERLAFFSDAVVAIAITLLALDLPVPHGHTNAQMLRDIGAHGNGYLAFAISFLVIGNYWRAHHRIFGNVRRLGGWLLRWDMLWLLMIVLTPFATRVLTSDGAFPIRFGAYALIQAIASLAILAMNREIIRHGLGRVPISAQRQRAIYRRLGTVIVGFAISIPIGFWTSWAYLCWAAIPVVSGIWSRVSVARAPGHGSGG